MGGSGNRRWPTAFAVALVAVLALAACGPAAARQAADDGRITVVTSTDVWGSVVRAVGGDHVSVKPIIDSAGADPHSYNATALDAAKVREADLVVYNGGGYDPFMAELTAGTRVPSLAAVRLAGHAESGDGAHGHSHSGRNEHVWYDLHAVEQVANVLARELGSLHPAAAQAYRDNAAAFTTKLADIADTVESIAAEHAGTEVLTTSPLAHYLLSAAGLESATPPEFTEAVEEGTGIPILAQHHVKELLTGGKVDVMIKNAQTVTPVVEKLAEIAGEHGIPVVGVRETLPEGSRGYLAWMNTQVQTLAGALTAE